MSQVIAKTGFVENKWDTEPPLWDEFNGGESALIPVTVAAEDVLPAFDKLRFIVIPFEKSADGRGFSLAARLRELGYEGHLRGQGHILVDQFRAALRSGLDDIEISDVQAKRNPETQWLSVPQDLSYQDRLFFSDAEGASANS